MSLTDKDVRHVARLSAISVTEEEIPQRQKELGDIVDYFNKLSAVPTNGVPPTSHVHGVVNAFREDIAKDSLKLDDIVSNAPDFANDSFRVPKII